MKVLIVDDIETNRKLLRVNFESEGIETCEATDGIEALSALQHEKADVVISDILMPHMDGYALCQKVRKDDRFEDLPFIFYTSTYTSPGDEKLALDCGADRYIRKPSPVGEIITAIRELSHPQWRRQKTAAVVEESFVMREYNEALVRKLEERNQTLEQARSEIALANEQLQRRVEECKHAEDEIRGLNAKLEQRVVERTAQLQAANEELAAFSFSVSHDLRAPLRHVLGFVELLQKDAGPSLSDKSLRHLRTISESTQRMGDLIEDLLAFAHIGQSELQKTEVDLNELIRETLGDFQVETKGRNIVWAIQELPAVWADVALLRLVLVNLISNALKFTNTRIEARIEIGCAPTANGETLFFVRDNGAGFDPKYAGKLFGVFQRLHSQSEFAGTGIGLANVQRIIRRHGGRVCAESAVDAGATFYFSIPKQNGAIITG
jgi:signal transduction histidine kinase